MLKIFKSLLVIGAIVGATWIVYAFFDRQFKMSNVKGEWPEVVSYPITEKDQKILKEVFSPQSFHYLDRGKQSFVFISPNGRYVLKFFDARCLRSGDNPFLFPIDEEHCAKKLKQLFEGYQVAAANEAADAGILFLQLAPDPSYTFYITIIDRFSIKHDVNLAEVPFVLQQRAVPLRDLITSLLNTGKVDEAKERLRQIVDMYVKGYKQGILDVDHNFMYNTGFVGDRPMRIDLGRLKIDEKIKDPRMYGLDLEKIMIVRLGGWLERHFPKYRQDILKDMKVKLDEVSKTGNS